ncbi:MAG: energy transducer TonB [Marinoscillum sp.]
MVNVESKKGIGYGCDKEAVRVIKESPKWNPGYYKGDPAVVRLVVPIIFSLNNSKTS